MIGNKKVREIFERIRDERKKEEFKRRLKYGKPQGRTRPPMRLTDDPGPH